MKVFLLRALLLMFFVCFQHLYLYSQNFSFIKGFGSTSFGASLEAGTTIATDQFGNVYVAGFFANSVDFDPSSSTSNLTSFGFKDGYLAKFDSNGNFVWVKQFGGSTSDEIKSILINNNNEIFLAGYFTGTSDMDPSVLSSFNLISSGDADGFIIKLNSNGDFVWSKKIGGSGFDEITSIAIDPGLNIYATGRFSGTSDFDPNAGTSNLVSNGGTDAFVLKLDSNGNLVSARSIGADGYDQGISVSVDANWNVVLAGRFYGYVDFDHSPSNSFFIQSFNDDMFVQKVSQDGTFLWVKTWGGSSQLTIPTDIEIDNLNNIYISSYFNNEIDVNPGSEYALLSTNNGVGGLSLYRDHLILKLDQNGNLVWYSHLPSPGTNYPTSISLDNEGDIIVLGVYQSSLDINPTSATKELPNPGNDGMYIQQIDSNGNFISGFGIVASFSSVFGLAQCTRGKETYFTGSFNGSNVDFNYSAATSTISAQGSEDVFLLKVTQQLIPTLTLTSPNGNTVVYGNTLNGFVLTENSDGAVSWSVTNGTGAATYDAATNTLTPTQAGTVTLTATTAQTATYAQGSASLIITISPKALTITGTTVQTTKEYNRNVSVQITNAGTLDGVLAADVGQVTLTTGTASYADFHVGTNKAITFTAFSLGGAKAGNYTLAAQPTATTGSITAKPVSITGVTVQAKNYDGTTAATINNVGTVNGLIAPDVLTAQAGTATFADANAGTNKTVNLTGFTLSGNAAVLANYVLNAQPTATGTITPATPVVTMTSTNSGVVNGTITLTANTGGSDGTLTFERQNLTGTATLAGNQLSLTAAGTVQVRALVAATTNFAAATSAWQTITISNLLTPTLTLTSPNGNTVVMGNTLTGFVLTENSDGAVSWSVTNGSGAATYDAATNTLTPTQAGTVTLTATTAQTATYAQGSASITITILLPAPTLYSPSNAATGIHPTTNFYINYIDGLTSLEYQFDSDNDFTTNTTDAVTNTITNFSNEVFEGSWRHRFGMTNLKFGKTYYWRVRVSTGATNTSAWSSVRSFSIIPSPTLYSPNDVAAGIHPTTNFYINYIDGLTSLEYQFDSDNDFTTNTADAVTNTITNFSNEVFEGSWRHRFQMTNLKFGKTYYWRVRVSTSAINTSAWSSVRSFSTIPSPTLYSPNDVAAGIHPTTNFYINYIDGLTSLEYQFDSDNDFTTNTADAVTNTITNFSNEVFEGSWRHRFQMTNLKFGKTYYWRVRVSTSATNSSAWSSVRSFSTIPSPTLYSPTNAATSIHPTTNFYINYIDGLTSLEYQFDSDNDFTTATADALTSTITNFSNEVFEGSWRHRFGMTNLKFGKTYYWRVRVSTSATNSSAWSSVRSFSTIVSPTLTAPNTNALNISTAGTNLTWQDLSGESGYEVQLSTSNLYESFIVNAAQTTTTRTTGALAANTTYFWRVRAKITIGANDFYSAWAERVFSTGATIATPPASPTLTAPTNNATNQIFTPTLTWSVVAGASYEYQYSTDQNFLTNVIAGTTTAGTNQYQTPALADQTTYYWRVRAIQNNLASAWSATFNFTTKRNVTIAFSNTEPVYDGTAKGITVTTTPAGVAYTIAYSQGGNTIANPTNAGDYLATVTITDNTYQLTNANTATLSIKQRPTTLAFANTTHTYDGTAKTITVTTTPTGVPNTVTYTPIATPTNAGTYTATVTLNSTNHIISGTNTATLTINPATPVVTMTSANSGVVNGTITLTANTGGSNGTITFERQNLTGTATLAGNQLSLTTIGTVQVRALVAATTNYNTTISDWQTITINNLLTPTLSLTGTNTVVYGNTLNGFVLTENSDGAVSWSVTNGSGAATYDAATNTLTPTQAGTVTLTATTAQTATYAQGTASLVITISPKTLMITGTTVQTTKEYNRNVSVQITNAGTLEGVLAADVGQVTLTTGTASYADFNVGTNKAISFTGFSLVGAKVGNYTLAAQPTATTGSITAKPVSITGVTVQAKNYDGTTAATINNAGTVNGLIAPDVLTAQAGTATFADANAGTNKTVNLTGFTLSGAAGVLSNYTLSAQPQAISNGIINQATLTAVAENKSRVYGQANPTLTIQYTGFVNNETAAVLDQSIQVATTATAESNVGTYPITLTGGVDNNYAINKGNGILTITQATQTITVTTQSGTRALSNGTFTVEAFASSNLPLTVTSSNPAIASVNGNTITMHQLGEVTLTFSQAGNQNYLPATNVTRTFTIVNETRVIGLTTEALVEPVIVGFPHLRLITVSNTGNAPLTINNIAHSTKVTLDDAQFTIAAGATHTVAATLVVAEEGTYTEELVFESDATSGSNTITLNGEAFLITNAEESHQTEMKVGPNPGENFINIKGKIKSDVLIKDLQGRVIKRKLSKAEEKDSYILDIHDLPLGMFLLEIKTVNDKSITKKIIKK